MPQYADPPKVQRGLSADRILELTYVAILITGGLGLGRALLGVFEATQVWLLGLLLTGFYGAYTRCRPLHLNAYMRWTHVALLVVVTLFFRLPARVPG